MLDQFVQVFGSVLILAAFVAAQRGRLDPKSPLYLALNAAGSLVLAVDAAVGREWGFLLLEGVWAVVSVVGLGGELVRRRAKRL
ncbi:hypothetical protein [Leifsonia sp. fls2-241-R2A-40a]|uniref:CBU_0592 family membrane protein n=1 Tax=Leifsonia sp. fls2-241-R2A-40a TaxID=3040290 RepID=UPI00254E17E7|nr:hypothetical protein [Leifsonia sp. fls2-241-R2A-40a]